MQIRYDSILAHLNDTDYFGFTANSIITNHRLVMGAGCAKAFKDKFPYIDQVAAEAIYALLDKNNCFYFAPFRYDHHDTIYKFFALQTKTHFKNKSPLWLIETSIEALRLVAMRHIEQFHLPFPGIGCGGSERAIIMPFLEQLPDNVIIYDYNHA